MLDEKTIEAITSNLTVGTVRVEGWTVKDEYEFASDENYSRRTVVVMENAAERYYKFGYEFNYHFSDTEYLDYMGITEVFPHPVTTFVYKDTPAE